LEIQYILQFWVIVHECQLDASANLVDHHGELLVPHRALVALLWVLQSANIISEIPGRAFQAGTSHYRPGTARSKTCPSRHDP
jgi:hypothetical protein